MEGGCILSEVVGLYTMILGMWWDDLGAFGGCGGMIWNHLVDVVG
jgi:hypothetical protein